MPCYKFTYRHSAMHPDYIGKTVKYASSEKDALALLSKGGTNYSLKTKSLVDKKGNTLTILNIIEEN
jgi:hypothetical protein